MHFFTNLPRNKTCNITTFTASEYLLNNISSGDTDFTVINIYHPKSNTVSEVLYTTQKKQMFKTKKQQSKHNKYTVQRLNKHQKINNRTKENGNAQKLTTFYHIIFTTHTYRNTLRALWDNYITSKYNNQSECTEADYIA